MKQSKINKQLLNKVSLTSYGNLKIGLHLITRQAPVTDFATLLFFTNK
jgi:hypothetical protein